MRSTLDIKPQAIVFGILAWRPACSSPGAERDAVPVMAPRVRVRVYSPPPKHRTRRCTVHVGFYAGVETDQRLLQDCMGSRTELPASSSSFGSRCPNSSRNSESTAVSFRQRRSSRPLCLSMLVLWEHEGAEILCLPPGFQQLCTGRKTP